MTKADQQYQNAVRQMGCCVCKFVYRIVDLEEAEIHHILNGNRRISEQHVLGLCAIHHRQGVADHPSRHSVNGGHGGKAQFESHYGVTEFELMERQEQWIDGRDYA